MNDESNTGSKGNLAPKPAGYEQRIAVLPALRDWGTEYPGYNPTDYTSQSVLTHGKEQGWADNEDPRTIDFQRPSFEGELQFDKLGRPLNPMGRQGIAGRGELGKWGVNNAADPIVIAVDEAGHKSILLIRRRDTGEWALPGGMVDPGEHVSITAKRELKEEAGIDLADVPSIEVAKGYVNDPRNTDNSWMETVASLMVVKLAHEPTAGDDADQAQWFELTDVDALNETTGGLYASHGDLIAKALEHINNPS
jgi:ADP-ribose pyrophosphatase